VLSSRQTLDFVLLETKAGFVNENFSFAICCDFSPHLELARVSDHTNLTAGFQDLHLLTSVWLPL